MRQISIQVTDELSSCTECGYTLGFHVSLRRDKDELLVILHCPHCGAQYETGWSASEPRLHEEKVE